MTDREFEILFRAQFKPLCQIAYNVLRNFDDARDTVQQVFLNFWQRRDEFKIHTSPEAYFYKAVLNTAINRQKQSKRRIPFDNSIQESKYSDENNDSRDYLLEQVNKVIDSLPPVCQKVFRLSRFTTLSNKEIAEELGISVKAVEKHITKAFKILREDLKCLIAVNTLVIPIVLILLYYLNNQVGYFSTFLSLC